MNVPMGSTRPFFSNCVRLSLAPWKGLQRCSRISSPPLTFVQFVRAQSEDQRITRLHFSNNTKRKFSRTFLNSIQTTLLYFSLFDCIFALDILIIHAPPNQVSQDGRLRRFKQWPKGLLGRRRLATTSVNYVYVSLAHAYVTLIKSTYLLTYCENVTNLWTFSVASTIFVVATKSVGLHHLV